jgi:hypothetical protein
LLFGTKSTLGVVGLADGLLLGDSLAVLSGLTSFDSAESLKHGDRSLNHEGSVLGLILVRSMSLLLACAAVGLADLRVLGVGD